MKFIVDGMLGKSTRWLRMLGQDAKYSIKFNDEELITTAKEDHRVILTRDSELFKRAIAEGITAVYVDGRTEPERLAQIAKRFGFPLAIDLKRSRCPRCNAKIRSTPKEKLVDKLKKNTFIHYDEFWKCPKCGYVYWQGAHWTSIYGTLEEAKKILKDKSVA